MRPNEADASGSQTMRRGSLLCCSSFPGKEEGNRGVLVCNSPLLHTSCSAGGGKRRRTEWQAEGSAPQSVTSVDPFSQPQELHAPGPQSQNKVLYPDASLELKGSELKRPLFSCTFKPVVALINLHKMHHCQFKESEPVTKPVFFFKLVFGQEPKNSAEPESNPISKGLSPQKKPVLKGRGGGNYSLCF